MAYQDDFRNKVIKALKAKNLAVDISQEATQQAIVEEAQKVAASESRPMSPEEMKLVLQDVAKQLALENQQLAAQNQQVVAQSYDFTAYSNPQLAGGPGNYPGGGFALSTAAKDIMIIPTAGTAGTVNTLSQIDFKFIYNPNAYGVIDPNEVKASIYNWAERPSGTTYDTPVLAIGGAWNGVSYTPNPGYGTGASTGSGLGGSIYTNLGRGNIIFLKPATSTINAALFNDIGLDSTASSNYFTITSYNTATPNANPTAGFAVSFGGIGGSGPIGISGAGSSLQYNQIKFLSPLSILNSTVTDTLTLGFSSAASVGTATSVYFVGGTGQTTAIYELATNAPSFTFGDMFYAAGTGHTTLAKLATGTNGQYLSSDGTKPVWSSSIAANTVAVNAASGSTILYPLLNNLAGAGSAVSTDIDFSVDPGNNILRYSSGSFYVGTAVSTPLFTSLSGMIIKPGVDSTTGVQIQTAAGATFVNLDTTNKRVGIGLSNPSYALDVVGDINSATGQSYRIAGNLVLNAGGLGTGVTNSSLTSVGTIGTGIWQGSTIGTTYGGTGSNLGGAIGNSNKVIATGTIANGYAATVIDGSSTGYFLMSNANATAPTFSNSSSAAFTFTGGVAFNTIAATSNVTPSNANDLTNKSYVDSISGGLDPHASVRLTTISAIGGSYRQSGTAGTLSGFGDYILASTLFEIIGSATGFDTPTSGIALTFNQRVLVKDGVTGGYASGSGAYGAFPATYGGIAASYVANGIYTVTSVGGAATSGWLLVRASDTDNQFGVAELTGGTFTFVEEGTNFADNGFVCTNDTTTLGQIGFGATQIAWSPFSGGASLTMGQGLSKTGNTIATNFNLAGSTSVVANLFQGFTIGGTRAGSVGSSSYATLTVTSTAASNNTLTADTTGFTLAAGQANVPLVLRGLNFNNTITGNTDGWTHSGGQTSRTLTVIGGDLLVNGGGFGLTLGSNSVLSLNGNTIAVGSGSSNITFISAVSTGTTTATTHYLVQNGQAQYQLSTTAGTFTTGDFYYGGGSGFTGLLRLAISGAIGNSVLISSGTAPAWGKIALADGNFVSGVLPITYGGTNAQAGNFTSAGVVVYDGANLRLASATGLTMSGVGLSVTGTVSSSSGYFVGSTAVLSGTAGQVAYYGTSNTAIGNTFLAFSPTAVSGVGLSVGVNSVNGTILSAGTAVSMQSGSLIDFSINGTSRFNIDWKGMATLTNSSAIGNTALVIVGGRTLFPAPTANYATLNLAASAAVNPGVGITQVGDLWFNGTNLYFRKDSNTTQDLLVGSVSGTGFTDRVAKWSSGSGLTYSNMSESPAGVGMTITSLGSIAAGGGTTALLTLLSLSTDDTKTDRYFIRGMSGAGGTRYFSIDTAGNLRATTKSFDIPHPTKEGMRLVYGVLEGPEHGVYHRGTIEGKGLVQVNLPDYWNKLVGDQYTIQLTPWGNYNVSIDTKTENYFTIQLVGDAISRKFKKIKVDYLVHGSRLDAPLDIEQ